ncbi:hypothetical protein NQD34_011844 [Periophthalmus magnuspinnatus]|nr:hypothetical protein NQD34_011844 [Periophthalmus magnuspinnatus]
MDLTLWQYQFRIIMLGDSTVGKSSLLKRYTEDLSVTRSYYRNSVGGLLVFDMTNRASFEHIKEWHAEVCERVQPFKVVFVLVGHKGDLEENGERAVSRDEAEKLAGQLGMPYVETSAKTGQNVREAFEMVARRVYQGLLSGEVQYRRAGMGSSVPLLRLYS